jgi:DNA-binding SARP family transcriptional activator
LRLKTIGGLWIEGEAAPSLGPRPLALLALVAAAGKKGISRDRVVGILWAESSEEQARHTLSQTLYNLRREAGRDLITGATVLQLDPSLSSDVGELRVAAQRGELERVADLYTGRFLDGFFLPGAPEFERWAEEERTTLEREAVRALERLARQADDAGKPSDSVRWWHRLAELDPLSARYAAGHMTALAAAGDRSGALARARLYRELIHRELGTEPDATIQKLEQSLRTLPSPHVPVPVTPVQAPVAAGEPRAVPGQAERSPRVAWVVAVTLAAIVLGVVVVRGLSNSSSRSLPFLAVGTIRMPQHGDSSSFAPVLRDMLATSLGSIAGLRVVANSRLIELMPRGADTLPGSTSDAARRAGATEILEGELVPSARGFALTFRRVSLASGVVRKGYSVRASDATQLIDSATAAIARDLELDSPAAGVAQLRTSSPAAYALYEEGLRAFYKWDAAAGYRLMKAAFERDSTFAMAAFYGWWASRGITSHPEGDRELLDRAKLLAPRAIDRERLLIEGSVATMDAPLATLLAIAETLSVRYPDDPDGQNLLGSARQAAGDWGGAIAAFERAVAIDSQASATPGSFCRLCVALGSEVNAYVWWDSADAAVRTARRFVALRPHEEGAWSNQIEPLLRLGRRDEALAAIQKRDSVATLPFSYQGTLQRDLIRWGRFEELDPQLLDDLASPSVAVRSEARWIMLFSLRNQGRLREAMALARDQIIPGSSRQVPGLQPEGLTQVTLLMETGQPKKAAEGFRGVAANTLSQQLTPGFKARFATWMLTLAGTALAAAGDTAGLHRLADSTEQIGKGSNWGRDPRLHHFLRGLLLQRQGHHAEAVEAFRRAVHSTSDGFTRINLEMAKSLMALRRAPEAIAILQSALRGNVDGSNTYLTHTELHEAIAQAFEQAGQRDSAAAHWKAVESAWRHADPQFRERYLRAREKAGR